MTNQVFKGAVIGGGALGAGILAMLVYLIGGDEALIVFAIAAIVGGGFISDWFKKNAKADAKKGPAPAVDAKTRKHDADVDARLARIETVLAEMKRQNDALTEDYRFMMRVLDKDK